MTHTRSDAVYKTTVEVQPKRRRLRIQDPDFVPPDGGWGWLIVVACGFSNVCNISNDKRCSSVLALGSMESINHKFIAAIKYFK